MAKINRAPSFDEINILNIPSIDALFSIKHIIEGPKLGDVLQLLDAIIDD